MTAYRFLRTLAAICCLSVFVRPASAGSYDFLEIPRQIQYQGRVTQNGVPWSGDGYFVFALIENGTVLWNNLQGTYDPSAGTLTDPGTVPLSDKFTVGSVTGGSFSVRLGSDTAGNNKPVLPSVFFNEQSNSVRPNVKLAVWFSADSQTFTRLSLEVSLASVPYAMVAGIAETVQDRAVSAPKLTNSLNQALIPPGTILPFGGTFPPSGFLICDGSALSSAEYPGLFAVIRQSSGNGSQAGTGARYRPVTAVTDFNLPDLRGRFLRGADDPDGPGIVYGPAGRDPDSGASSNGGADNKRYAPLAGGVGGNTVGSVQNGSFAAHYHPVTDKPHTHDVRTRATYENPTNDNAAGGAQLLEDYQNFNATNSVDRPNARPSYTGITQTESAGGNETRPANAAVNYIIKY